MPGPAFARLPVHAGGLAGCPGFAQRFESELRPQVPDDFALGVRAPPVSTQHTCVGGARGNYCPWSWCWKLGGLGALPVGARPCARSCWLMCLTKEEGSVFAIFLCSSCEHVPASQLSLIHITHVPTRAGPGAVRMGGHVVLCRLWAVPGGCHDAGAVRGDGRLQRPVGLELPVAAAVGCCYSGWLLWQLAALSQRKGRGPGWRCGAGFLRAGTGSSAAALQLQQRRRGGHLGGCSDG